MLTSSDPRLPRNQEAGIGIAHRRVTTPVFSGGTVPSRKDTASTYGQVDHVNNVGRVGGINAQGEE